MDELRTNSCIDIEAVLNRWQRHCKIWPARYLNLSPLAGDKRVRSLRRFIGETKYSKLCTQSTEQGFVHQSFTESVMTHQFLLEVYIAC